MSKNTVTYIPLKDGGYNSSDKKAHFYLGDIVTFNENVRVIVYEKELQEKCNYKTTVKIDKRHTIVDLFKTIFNKNTKVKI